MRMQRFVIPAVLAILALGHWAQAEVYDFFELSRYPLEGKLRPWVELRKVTVEGDGDPQKYNRRLVKWWPRKGVDYVELRDGMIEREWTLAPSAMDPECKARVTSEMTTTELESLGFPPNFGHKFMARVRG